MKITLLSLESTLYQKTGNKNIVRQLLASKLLIPLLILKVITGHNQSKVIHKTNTLLSNNIK